MVGVEELGRQVGVTVGDLVGTIVGMAVVGSAVVVHGLIHTSPNHSRNESLPQRITKLRLTSQPTLFNCTARGPLPRNPVVLWKGTVERVCVVMSSHASRNAEINQHAIRSHIVLLAIRWIWS